MISVTKWSVLSGVWLLALGACNVELARSGEAAAGTSAGAGSGIGIGGSSGSAGSTPAAAGFPAAGAAFGGAAGASDVLGHAGAPSAAGSVGVGGNNELTTPAARGATVPYFEMEAEDSPTTGVVLPASRRFGEVAAESSGRRAVRLDRTGQSIDFTLARRANSIVVRYSIPDATDATDATDAENRATLGVYVGSTRKATLQLTSRYAWTYGDEDAQGEGSELPGAGTPHHFYDEAHVMFDEVPAGTVVRLQRDAQDTAAHYVVDLADFELVPPPLSQPPGSLSIVEFGASADDGSDDSGAIQKGIDAARAQNKVLWIPKGTFDTAKKPAQQPWPKLRVAGVEIRGAGMWHSTLRGFGAQFVLSGNGNRFFDFALFGDVTYRDDTKGWQGFDGPAGTGSRLENLWIEHQTAGYWCGKGGFQGPVTAPLTDGLVIRGVRIRNVYADGVNLANATRNSIIEQSSFRNTGDDAIATWSFSADGPLPTDGNVFRFNTIQTVWRANCIALYGGKDNRVEDNVCSDTSNYPGVMLSTTFSALPFTGTTLVQRNTLLRAGGKHYVNQEFGALRFMADQQPISNIRVQDLDIQGSTFAGLQFGGSQNLSGVVIAGVTIRDSGAASIRVNSESRGSAELAHVTVQSGASQGLQNDAPSAFDLKKGAGNSGW